MLNDLDRKKAAFPTILAIFKDSLETCVDTLTVNTNDPPGTQVHKYSAAVYTVYPHPWAPRPFQTQNRDWENRRGITNRDVQTAFTEGLVPLAFLILRGCGQTGAACPEFLHVGHLQQNENTVGGGCGNKKLNHRRGSRPARRARPDHPPFFRLGVGSQ